MIKGPSVPREYKNAHREKTTFPSAAELKGNRNRVTNITEIVMYVSFVSMKTLY